MYIRVNDPILNRNVGKYELPHVYDNLLNREGGQCFLKDASLNDSIQDD